MDEQFENFLKIFKKLEVNIPFADALVHMPNDFSKIVRPLCRLLEKDATFVFDEVCLDAFMELKKRLISAPIMIVLDWNLPFEIMCDTSDFSITAILGQRHEKFFPAIYYVIHTLNEVQENYTTTRKEMLAVVYSCGKLRSYCNASKIP